MKLFRFVMFFLCLAFVTANLQAQEAETGKGKAKEKKVKAVKAKNKEIKGNALGNQEIQIKTSAQCDMCKDRIEKALALEKGVKRATLDVDSKVLTVVYNSNQIKPEQIKAAVTKVGYDADELQADADAYKKLPGCCKKGGH